MAKLNSNRKALEQVARLALSGIQLIFLAYSRLLSLKNKQNSDLQRNHQ